MSNAAAGTNTISAAGTELLLVGVGGGSAVHLAGAAAPGEEGRAAVPDHYLGMSRLRRTTLGSGYDRDVLLEPRWTAKTLCGRHWDGMEAGDGGPIYLESDEPVYAPTCRRCLSLMDRLFPDPIPDGRLPLVVRLVTDAIVENGFAEVHGVPGDQQKALREQVRRHVRERTGNGSRTYAVDSLVVFSCEAIYQRHRDRHTQAAGEIATRALGGQDVPAATPDWRLSWGTWAVDS